MSCIVRKSSIATSELITMPVTNSIQKRARKSIAPIRPPIVPPPSTNLSIDGSVCHLCGYLGRTKPLSIEKNGYNFLRHLPPASGALPVNENTHHVRACHLCGLLLDKQRELNYTSNNFFFKGFFRSIGSCHINNELSTKAVVLNSPDELEQSSERDQSKEVTLQLPSPQRTMTETDAAVQPPLRSAPPPLRKTTSAMKNSTLNLHSTAELSSLDSFLTSVRSRFLSDYTSVISSSKQTSCHLCLSIKPYGTLYTVFKSQFEFLSTTQIDVCTLCYYNLMDQYRKQVNTYRRPRPQCYLCRCRINFIAWEIKLLETEHFPFVLNLSRERNLHDEQLYDNQRLALACDQCFYTLLFQYIEQQRQNIPIDKRTYSWQCTYSYENEHFFENYDSFYTSNNKTT